MNKPTDAPEQLSFQLGVRARPARPANVVVPLQFRVSEATAQRGLQHVAELRQLLSARQAARDETTRPTPLPRRRPAA